MSVSSPFDPIEAIFCRLDRWRNLPAYQLERRADIFFSVYLSEVIAETTGVELTDTAGQSHQMLSNMDQLRGDLQRRSQA